ncbi:trigger factor [Candidatus Parcubacteria bacterium]|jgi:trigger factor|nr:trigger factor [Candidatus Parcubacteria bacterium]
MQITKKDLGKGEVELTIEVSLEELKPHLENAAISLSKKHKVPGFRPGKAPLDLIKNKFGDMALYQEALDAAISDSFYKAVTREKLQTVGQPKINVDKMAPDNPLIYKAVVALLPKVTLGEWQKISVTKKEVKAEDSDINKTLEQLQTMNVKETVAERVAKKGDKVELDFEVYLDKVIIEGGKNPKYPIVIGESKMIPGFEEHIIGLKTGDKKEFELKFPAKYFQNNLAGKLATFKIKVLQVFDRELPKIDDGFAKGVGFEDLAKLKKQLVDNITQDKQSREKQRVESESIQEIVKTSEFSDLPELLIDNEIHKMIHELEHNITSQGMDMAGYLKSINKTHDDLHKDFRVQATERVKAALVLRQLATEEKITADDKEVEAEIAKQKETYKDNKQALQNIENTGHKQHMANMITNQKIIELIAKTVIK